MGTPSSSQALTKSLFSYLLAPSPAAEQGKRSEILPCTSAGSLPPLSGMEQLIIALFPL